MPRGFLEPRRGRPDAVERVDVVLAIGRLTDLDQRQPERLSDALVEEGVDN
jgi:hypothetical protein